ncbi:MAG: phosphoribosylglycinamide formyltransferase [Bacteroidales bacterium]|nr:phosphoribosylglycinamide formyltransferase [Bacteroidales bacterium]
MNKATRIAIFGSGNGTNAQRITEYFAENPDVEVNTIITNKKDAYIVQRAKNLGIDCTYFSRHDFFETDNVLNYLKERNIDYVILAGFLWLVPQNLLSAFPKRIINIHPALLPKYGGKGMYGEHVHEAVIANHETESGITIHFVDEHYDRGTTIFQATCDITPDDTPDTLAQKIHKLEHEHFPKVIEKVVLGQM